jgi:hypothetical protein
MFIYWGIFLEIEEQAGHNAVEMDFLVSQDFS